MRMLKRLSGADSEILAIRAARTGRRRAMVSLAVCDMIVIQRALARGHEVAPTDESLGRIR